MNMNHLISTKNLSKKTIINILDTTEYMSSSSACEIKKKYNLVNVTMVNLFFEESTRTKVSFEIAAKNLSIKVINFSLKHSSMSKGESIKDTIKTLEAMGVNCFVIRHWASGILNQIIEFKFINKYSSIINAGDGFHEHPTQALLDAFTLRKHWNIVCNNSNLGCSLDGMKIIIIGDIFHSRVARSNLWLLNKLGAKITLVAPPTLIPLKIKNQWPCKITYNLDNVICKNFDAIMLLRLQKERMNQAFFPSIREYVHQWGLNSKRFDKLSKKNKKHQPIILHPGPVNRGIEISSKLLDSKQAYIVKQIKNGIALRMAIFSLIQFLHKR